MSVNTVIHYSFIQYPVFYSAILSIEIHFMFFIRFDICPSLMAPSMFAILRFVYIYVGVYESFLLLFMAYFWSILPVWYI